MRTVHRSGGITPNLKHSVIHEGKTAKVTNGNWEDTIEMRESGTSFSVNHKEIRQLDFREILRRWDESANDFAKQKNKILIEKLNHVTDSTGNTIHESDPVESIFKMIETIELDFLEDGSLTPGFQIVAGPKSAKKLQSAFDEIYSNPKLTVRWERLLERKRDEWRYREASRTLVE